MREYVIVNNVKSITGKCRVHRKQGTQRKYFFFRIQERERGEGR
jgi:hypothetical protein